MYIYKYRFLKDPFQNLNVNKFWSSSVPHKFSTGKRCINLNLESLNLPLNINVSVI